MSVANTLKFVCSHPLNRTRPMHALATFARWQFGSRLLSGQEFVFSWVNGAKFRVRRGQTGLTGNIYAGLHEFEEMAFLLHYLRKEDLFLDVGANVGSYTILACAAVGSNCIAVEPVPATFAALVENVRLNHREHATQCANMALGDSEGTVTFTIGEDTVNHVVAQGEKPSASVTVPMQALDTLLAGRKPRLAKIDVEGFETSVLAGAEQTLSGSDPMAVIMELNGSGDRYGFDESALLAKMFGHGFGAYRYEPFDRRLSRLDAKNAAGGNTIFIRGEADALERIRSAPKFHVRQQQV